jgi:hypothetical protein
VLKVPVGREDMPAATMGDGTDQKVNRRPCDPMGPAPVVHAGRFFVVRHLDHRLVESAQLSAQFPERTLLANPRKQFLPDRSQNLRPAFPN